MSRLLALAATAMLTTATAADATQYLFTLSGTNSASFTLDDTPQPSFVSPNAYFTISGVTGSFADASGGKLASADVSFYSAFDDGGFAVTSPNNAFLFSDLGAQLFTGTLSNPTFKTGTFAFTQGYSPFSGTSPVSDRLVISAVAGAVPEAGTWAMFIGGLGLVGSSLRRRGAKPALA